MSDDLIERLQVSVGLSDGYGNFGRLRNPDGPRKDRMWKPSKENRA